MSDVPELAREDPCKKHQHLCLQEPEEFERPQPKRVALKTNPLIEHCKCFDGVRLLAQLDDLKIAEEMPQTVLRIAVIIAGDVVQREDEPCGEDQLPPGLEDAMKFREGKGGCM